MKHNGNLRSKLIALTCTVSLILVFIACKKEDDGTNLALLNTQESTQTAFADEKTTNGFTFTAKDNWTAVVDASWLTLFCNGIETYNGSKGTFAMTISLDSNYLGQTRKASIEIASKNDKITIIVTQSGTTEEGELIMSEIAMYERIIALKEQYPEGMKWTNDDYYQWKGGVYTGGYGCMGFAFLLSDAAFGNLPARKHYDFNNLRIGDVLRINDDTHSVIIIGIDEKNITIAEGNYNYLYIHWGRKFTIEEVKNIGDYILTRYPKDKIS